MRQAPATVIGGIGGALLMVAVIWVFDGRPSRPRPRGEALLVDSRGGESAVDGSGIDAALSRQDAELRAIRSQLETLSEQVAQLQRSGITASGGDRVAVERPATAVVDVESLVAAIDELEQRKLDAMTDDELLRSAREMQENGDGAAESIRRIEAVLARSLSDEKRAEVMMQLAMVQRSQRTPESLAASERSLQAVIDANGVDSRPGLHATYQLIWTASAQENPGRALELARAYARSPSATPGERQRGRWAAAIMRQQLGDVGGARAEFEQLLREIEGQPGRAGFAEDIRRRMANL